MTSPHLPQGKPAVRTYSGITPREGDVITLDVIVVGLYQDGTIAECEMVDEEGRTIAQFYMPTGYGNIVWRAPEEAAGV